MRLATWTALRGRGALMELHRATKRIDGVGVSYSTLHQAARGTHLLSYPKAKLIEQATDGAVTVDELCGAATNTREDPDNGDTQAQ